MPIMVNSPYSGRPVKVRDQDIGRAVRDEEGRIFYVLKRSDGKGFYSSPTRAGGPKDEARYLEMEQKMATAQDTGARLTEAQLKQVHDATGKARGKGRRLAYILLLIIILAGVAYALRDKLGFGQQTPHIPTELLPGPSDASQSRSLDDLRHHRLAITLVFSLSA
jgi:hypothetical protein